MEYKGNCLEEAGAQHNNADKDRAFLACHNGWVKNLEETMTPALEAKAMDLFC